MQSLTDLLKKDRKWEWTGSCRNAFEKLKEIVETEPVLSLPDFDKPFEVHTDASDKAIGGVLVQEGHPVAYESRKLKDAEQRYSTHEKEMTAVVHCLEVWRHYLLVGFIIIKLLAAPKLAWFQDVESMLNHHLAGLLGLGSLSWAGHLKYMYLYRLTNF